MITVATGNDNVRLAVDWAVAKATGGKIPTADAVRGARSSRTRSAASRTRCKCERDLPGDVYLSAQMPGAEQAKLLK